MRLHFCEVLQYNKSHRALVKSVIIPLYNNKAPTDDDFKKLKKLITMCIKCTFQVIGNHLCTSSFNHMALYHVHQFSIFK